MDGTMLDDVEEVIPPDTDKGRVVVTGAGVWLTERLELLLVDVTDDATLKDRGC